ncbi:S1 family peptidase [Aspergillus stella-maris]|uniref:S1 family peptidase n=1 Tax=Aspergillus stella-maris TaxID=1810926 RepID=UPI003CCD2281
MSRALRSSARQAANRAIQQETRQNPDPLPGLNKEETSLLRKKQFRLRGFKDEITTQASRYGEHILNALRATYIFAQAEAGAAVCIDPAGHMLTCAHCFGEDEEEWRGNQVKCLIDYAGGAVQVQCVAWDERRDLALAKVVRAESVGDNTQSLSFASIGISSGVSSTWDHTPIVCIGQPGADDLESKTPRATGYDLLEISEGRLRGLIEGADPQDNLEIGTLKHDAWSYWGHSGAPLVCRETGVLLGLHSSWDDQTAMRHGIPVDAVNEFLDIHLPGYRRGEVNLSDNAGIGVNTAGS